MQKMRATLVAITGESRSVCRTIRRLARVDSGVLEGDEVSVYYDPMISKLIVWGRDRTDAIRRLRENLSAYRIKDPNDDSILHSTSRRFRFS